MEINYIILAHKNPQQVNRLVNRLNSIKVNFYIHIDKSVDKTPFFNLLLNKKNVHFSSDNTRENGIWGDFGIVKATISILKKIVNDKKNGYCVLLSGQDYPIQNNESIKTFFKSNYGNSFIEIFALPFTGWANNFGLDRLTKYKINISGERRDFVLLSSFFDKSFYNRKSLKNFKQLLKKKQFSDIKKLFFKRKHIKQIQPYGGSQWWALPIETVSSILTYIDNNPEYFNYHKNSLLPDEMFFHSIIINLKKTHKHINIKPSITYVNWERKNTALPVTFIKNDINELQEKTNDKLFARKFDIDIDEEILDLIDVVLLV